MEFNTTGTAVSTPIHIKTVGGPPISAMDRNPVHTGRRIYTLRTIKRDVHSGRREGFAINQDLLVQGGVSTKHSVLV